MTAVLVAVAALVALGTAVMVWALCERPAPRQASTDEWDTWVRDAEGLAALAKERARQELADRCRRPAGRA